jgi:hypothetical protein
LIVFIDFFCKIPSVQKERIIAHGTDGQHAWWFKFNINVEHPLAWQTVQELGHVLNYLSTNERLPTQFFPVSPPPYMNGEAKTFWHGSFNVTILNLIPIPFVIGLKHVCPTLLKMKASGKFKLI